MMVVRKKKGKRRIVRRKRKGNKIVVKTGNRSMVPRYPILSLTSAKPPKVFPAKIRAKLIYEDDVTIVASAVSPQGYTFSCNNIFDPNVTGTGHQPFMHDQLGVFYNRYDVISSKIFVQWYEPDVQNNNLAWMRVFVLPVPNLTGLAASIYTFRESNLGSAIAPVGQWDFTGMFEKSHVEHRWSRKKVTINEDNDTGAAFGASPTKQYYYVIGIAPPTGADAYPVNHMVRVRIEYNVLCSEPRLQGES